MANKRSYTVPVLLLIIVVLTTIIVMMYSKLLIAQQQLTTDEGKRLAEHYLLANVYAERLSEASNLLLKDASMKDRLRGTRLVGESALPSLDMVAALTEAAHRSSGQPVTETFKPISIALSEINAKLSGIAEHDGPLTAQEKHVLTVVQGGAAKMTETLHRFRAPTGEAGYRQMQAGGDWIAAAVDAAKVLEDMASKLK